MRYRDKWPEYAQQWNRMKINPGRKKEFNEIAARLIGFKTRYSWLEAVVNVKWYHIALLHLRESNCDFSTYLGNGEPISRATRLVPKGRGPFASFEAGAIDALKLDGLTNIRDWRLEKVLYYSELFNGSGYNNRGLPSPYLWGGTNIQRPGKYVKDKVFDAKVMDSQPGIAPILQTMAKLDHTIDFIRED